MQALPLGGGITPSVAGFWNAAQCDRPGVLRGGNNHKFVLVPFRCKISC